MGVSVRAQNQLHESDDGSSQLDDTSTINIDNSGHHSTTEGSHRTGGSDDDFQTIKDALGREETKRVIQLRFIVVLILIAAAASISWMVYYIAKSAEVEEFELEYYGVANKIIDSFQKIMVEMSAISSLAVAATMHAQQQKELLQYSNNSDVRSHSDWPFVTLPNFQELAGNVRSLSGAIYVSINPIVEEDQLASWEEYTRGNANSWIEDGLAFQEQQGLNDFADPNIIRMSWLTDDVVDPVHTYDAKGLPHRTVAQGPFLPRWQTSPVLTLSLVNENLFENPWVTKMARDCINSKSAVLGGFHYSSPGNASTPNPSTAFFAILRSMWEGEYVEYLGDPMSHLVMPIFDTLVGSDRKVVAILKSTIHWRWYLRNLLPKTNEGIIVVMENACEGNYTYHLVGDEAKILGFGDLHDPAFSKYHYGGTFRSDSIEDGTLSGIPLNQKGCPYSFHVYASPTDHTSDMTKNPIVISVSVAIVFFFTIATFFFYDHLVERRQKLVLAKATQSTAIVSSLFPKQIRDRLLTMATDKRKGEAMLAPNHRLKTFLSSDLFNGDSGDQPIADFFPNCTIIYSDIVGFTAWSSTREPAQVFILLQTVYQNFDLIAKRRRVFKVETIGDSYLAVTGLPEPQKNHAVIMAKFAWDCLIRIGEITKELEVSLGPDTCDLSMRFGIHSGSVTAGVLKGDRARFQLFGDTVNTASRMENTSTKGRIQVSEATADLLKKAGKTAWLTERDEKVPATGKGLLTTYWLILSGGIHNGSSVASGENYVTELVFPRPSNIDIQKRHNLKEARLIDWVVDIFLDHVRKLTIVHERCGDTIQENENFHYQPEKGQICLDEVKEAIHMPKFDARVIEATLDSQSVQVPDHIITSLRQYVTMVARTYHDNAFHNFEHACHVTMSVNKLLSRVAAPDLAPPDAQRLRKGRDEVAAQIHDFTHGLASDRLAVFAITFSALIHDVDHQGVSNMQLMKERPEMGKHYRSKSLAEQNSLDVAWDIFMSDEFEELRHYIFGSRAELLRFRQLIVNVVLATDMFDTELGGLRKARWEQAFHGEGNLPRDVINNMRATIVMEHIIQASDVCHTMQHWHVYQKWNRKLFEELYSAWKNGRMGVDPRTFWYLGELSFFDHYIIPLAKKLKECNVFGVSSDEYLGYALRNRAEWEVRGEQILQDMISDVDAISQSSSSSQSDPGTADRLDSHQDNQSVDDTVSIQTSSSGAHVDEIV